MLQYNMTAFFSGLNSRLFAAVIPRRPGWLRSLDSLELFKNYLALKIGFARASIADGPCLGNGWDTWHSGFAAARISSDTEYIGA
jgi:hypothetical protein